MSFTLLQTAAAFGNSGTTSIAINSGSTDPLASTTAGALLVAYLSMEDGDTTITITGFTAGTKLLHANGDVQGQFFYNLANAGGLTTVTASFGGATRVFRRFLLGEFSYTGTCTFEAQNTGQGSSAALASGLISPSASDLLVFGGATIYGVQTTTNELINGQAADQVLRIGSGGGPCVLWWDALGAGFTNGGASAGKVASESVPWINNVIAFKTDSGGGSAVPVIAHHLRQLGSM